MADVRAHVRALIEAMPDAASVPVPRAWLALLLDEPAGTPSDLTVVELAARYRRGRSTIRAWAEAGRFPGAYKLGQREWRFPPASVASFDASDRPKRATTGRGEPVRLNAWREELPKAG